MTIPPSETTSAAVHSRLHFKLVAAMIVCSLIPGCRTRSSPSLPGPGSEAYSRYASSFYQGLAGLQIGDDVQAETSLSKASTIIPEEPAAWTDWGILALRQRTYDQAAERLSRAHVLAPQNDQIEYLLGLLESERGNSTAAIQHLQRAVQLNGTNLRGLYALASEVERQGDPGSEQRFEDYLQQSLSISPGNIAALLELCRVAAKRGDVPVLRQAVTKIALHSKDWPAEAKQQLQALQQSADGEAPGSAATRSIFLRNVLMRLPAFRADLSELKPDPGEGAQPLTHFLLLPNLSARPSPADRGMTFSRQPITPSGGNARWQWAGALQLGSDGPPVLGQANATKLRLDSGVNIPFPGGAKALAPAPEGILPVDFNYDFKTDLVLAGAGGVRLFRQENPSTFTDVTSETKLPTTVLNAAYSGAWAVDIEADGDLDILLGTSTGAPTLLRNNGDGSFTAQHPFANISGIQQLSWVDLNGDGNPDAAMLDRSGKLHLFLNQRSGNFVETNIRDMPLLKAITTADLGDGVLSLIAVRVDGSIIRMAPDEQKAWTSTTFVKAIAPAEVLTGSYRLFAADLDNNGAVDLVLSPAAGTSAPVTIWLQNDHGTFDFLPSNPSPVSISALADLDQNGRLSLIGLDKDEQLAVSASHGTKDYRWQTIRPRAKVATGDQRINSFGIGGEIEVRAGLLLQKQPIAGPSLHFGLGDQKQSDVARILWPNGSLRAEFNLKSNQQIVAEQRLKGSCPFLFAWNGRQMAFVKDSAPWGSAIGLRINALGAADIAATEEWYKIDADQLKPHEGFYDLRITGELWESYYYDSMILMTVDHPIGTEVYTDERFDVPPVKLAVTAVSKPQTIKRAIDDGGHDVTKILSKVDGNYLDNFGRGQYQGITRDHYVEIELPEKLPANTPLWLIANGWLHPSDSSINTALSQGSSPKPKWISLEVPDSYGTWRSVNRNLGFPAGRNKNCLIDISNIFSAATPHRLRLRTNLEIYWDAINWAAGSPDTPIRVNKLAPLSADLHYRGFSIIHQQNASSPELPVYSQLSGTSQLWQDLEGYYTRYGDVRELLSATDDRYVIMNAGDEISLRYSIPPPPPVGWIRDYVLSGDGWIKDGDYNSTYSQTVLPYPHHSRRNYNAPPDPLQKDYVYLHHPDDWKTYQTRYVTADKMRSALRWDSTQAFGNRP